MVNLSFRMDLHEVGGEEDGAVPLEGGEEVPHASPSLGVHTRGWLVQHHHLGWNVDGYPGWQRDIKVEGWTLFGCVDKC